MSTPVKPFCDGHSDFTSGDSILILADESHRGKSPLTLGEVSTSVAR